MTKRVLEVGFFVVLALVLLVRFGPELRSRTGLAASAPALELVTMAGDTVRTDALRGSVVLVNFWATWCAPCRVEMPAFQRVWEDYRDRGFVVLGLYTDTGPIADLAQWFRDVGVAYPFAPATPAAERGFGMGDVLPTSFLVDPDGRIDRRVEGIYPEDQLRSDLDRLLARPGGPEATPAADGAAPTD